MQFQKISIPPPHGRSSKSPRGEGILKVKILEAKHDAKLEFPGGEGELQNKKRPWGNFGYFDYRYISLPPV